MAKRVVLAYSGGLDTSVAVKWMGEELGVEVIAVACDVGQAGTDADGYWDALRQKALGAGAVEAEVVDCREEYAADYCVPALKANALYEGRYPLVSSLSRPVLWPTGAPGRGTTRCASRCRRGRWPLTSSWWPRCGCGA